MKLRNITPDDYAPIIAVLDDWWGGRQVSDMLPRLFFEHFRDTSFIALAEDGSIAGFLVGFLSQSHVDEAYIHFVGVHPDQRKSGVGKLLYERFFDVVQQRGRHTVKCVTSPMNKTSIAFHLRMGFVPKASDTRTEDGISCVENYDGKGESRVVFCKQLS
jgi:ribosomal protein S18 acetylase RimI-like enzyme